MRIQGCFLIIVTVTYRRFYQMCVWLGRLVMDGVDP
jgi:hypothetical protein